MPIRLIYLIIFLGMLLGGCDSSEESLEQSLDQGKNDGLENRPQDLSLGDLDVADLSLVDLDVADLDVADLSLVDLDVADLDVADLSLVDLDVADLDVADLSLVDLDVADLDVADLELPDVDVVDMEVFPSACLEDNGGCGPEAYFLCEDHNSEAVCIPLVNIHSYPIDPSNMPDHTYRVLIAMVNTVGPIPERTEPDQFGNQEHYSPQELGDVYFNEPTGVRDFIREASYGRVELYGEVVGWIHAPQEEMSGTDMMTRRSEFFEIACHFVDCADYDIFVLNGLVSGIGTNIGWTMQNSITVSQGHFMNVGFDYMINSPFYLHGESYSDGLLRPTASWPHELLHTLGISGHANSLWCAQDGVEVALGGSCENKAYGGVFSVMGERAFATHPDFIMKRELGWVDAADVHQIEITGSFDSTRFTLSPLEALPSTGQALGASIRLPAPVEVAGLRIDRLHIEHRSPLGLDSYLFRLDGPEAPDGGAFLGRYTSLTSIDRVGVHLFVDIEHDQSDTTWDIDAHPSTTYNPARGIKWPGNPGRFADAFLNIGEVFTSPSIPDVEIEVLQLLAGGGIEVEVRCIGPSCLQTTCGENQIVEAGQCVFCPAGMTRPAGDDPAGPDTSCSPITCPENSIGESVYQGCRCDFAAGWRGTINPSRFPPGYEGSCQIQ